MIELLQAIRCHAEAHNAAWINRVVRAPSDGFGSNGTTLKNIYDYVSIPVYRLIGWRYIRINTVS